MLRNEKKIWGLQNLVEAGFEGLEDVLHFFEFYEVEPNFKDSTDIKCRLLLNKLTPELTRFLNFKIRALSRDIASMPKENVESLCIYNNIVENIGL